MFRSVRARISLAMASLVLLLAVASGIAVREVMRLEELSTRVAAIDEAVRRLHRVSTAMRDAYAHQAHMVILDDRSHLDHYSETHSAALRAVDDARAVLDNDDDRTRLAAIARVADDLDASFRRDLLPHIAALPRQQPATPLQSGSGPGLLGGGVARAAAHEKAIHLVEQGQGIADALIGGLDQRAADIRVAVTTARERLFGRCAVLFAAALLLSIIVTFILDRQISVPVRGLERAARHLGTGDLQTRVVADGHHELASLARHFNDMAEQLQERERRLLEAERLASVGRLAAGVAHEINNPLGVMLGYVRLIERSADVAVAADASLIAVEIKRCQQIVAGLLDLARPPRLALVDVDIVALTRETAASLAPLADGSPRVRVHGDATATALVDEGKLTQVLRNLYSNAVDAAPDDAVNVDVAAGGAAGDAGEVVVVSVRDRGPGLSAEAKARLFEPFFTSKPRGTGLGLAVSRAFAEAHGGTLEHVESVNGDVGATLRLTVPRRPRQPAAGAT